MKILILFFAAVLSAQVSVATPNFTISCNHADAVYTCGESAVFTITVTDSYGSPARDGIINAVLDNFGNRQIAAVSHDLAKTNTFSVSGTLNEPGFLRLTLKSDGMKPITRSAAFDPLKIRRGGPRPADFDTFWSDAKKRLEKEVPPDVRLTRIPEKSTSSYDFHRLSLATFGRRVHGYMTVPKDKSRAPYPVEFQVCSADFASSNDINGRDDAICVRFSVFPFEPDWKWEEKGLRAQYTALNNETKNRYGTAYFCRGGITDSREAYFYYPVILGINRAVDWLAGRPDVDRTRFRYHGTSQGGGFGLYLCGLNKTFTRAVFYVPALCDILGAKAGRRSGWPLLHEAYGADPQKRSAVEKWGPYFDCANFASNIICPVRIVAGFADTTCPPASVYAAYNEIPSGVNKKILHGLDMGHICDNSFYIQCEAWMRDDGPDTLRAFRWTEDFVPAPDGVKLYTYSMAPAGTGKHPIVVSRSPYIGRRRTDHAAFAKSEAAFLSRGYARVYQHCRGSGASDGVRTPFDDQQADGLALLDYVRKLPWYNGEIFLVGSSYNATAHYTILDANPPDVKGAALYVQDVKRYNIIYRNGFFKIGLYGGWYLSEYHKNDRSLTRDKAVTFFQFPLKDFPKRYWGKSVPPIENVLSHPREDDPFWNSNAPGSGIDCRNALLKTKIPVLLKGSFYDIYTDGVCAMWRELPPERRANCSFIIDACGHNGRHSPALKNTRAIFPGGARREAGVEAEDWFDYVRTGKPPANAPLGKTRFYALWQNTWITTDELTDGPRRVVIPLGSGERDYTYDPLRPLPVFPGSGGICFGGMQLQPEPGFRDDVVSFILPDVTEELDVRGRMEAELSVSSDREDTCFYIRTSVDKGDGRWLVLRDDITSLALKSPYTPGTRRTLRFRFADHAFRLSPGDRLRVDVSSANSQFAPHPNVAGDAFAVTTPQTARNRIFAGSSRLILHVLEPQKP